MLTGEQFRMARAALRLTVMQAAELAGVDKSTIVRVEAGGKIYKRTLRDLRAAFENAGIVFLPAEEGVHAGAVGFKWGFEPAKLAKGKPADVTDSDTPGGGLDAMAWDWEAEPSTPLPEGWTEEDRADQIAYWRGRPERWAALAEVSRQCLLRAMGVDSLDAGDPAP
jgi:DNA-binding XRE family transcriptional regulator